MLAIPNARSTRARAAAANHADGRADHGEFDGGDDHETTGAQQTPPSFVNTALTRIRFRPSGSYRLPFVIRTTVHPYPERRRVLRTTSNRVRHPREADPPAEQHGGYAKSDSEKPSHTAIVARTAMDTQESRSLPRGRGHFRRAYSAVAETAYRDTEVMKRAVVVAIAVIHGAFDEVLYRPAVVKAFSWLPRWWLCDPAKLSIALDELAGRPLERHQHPARRPLRCARAASIRSRLRRPGPRRARER